MTHSIPPEGDEYNARRQEELHAAVSNKATLTRRLFELDRDGAPADQINAIIDVIASLDKEIPHISKDLAVSVQGRNLSIFLERMEVSLQTNTRSIESAVEAATVRALTNVAISLDQITSLVQQGIATGVKALAVGEKALGVSTSNARRLAQVERRFVEVEKTVMALKKGQTASDEQMRQFISDIADLRNEISALHAAAKEAARLAEEHQRLAALTAGHEKRLAEIEAWRAALEARSSG